MRDSVVIYRSFYEASKNMTPEEFQELWINLFAYALDDEEPEDMESPLAEAIITMARPQIDANTKRRSDGSKGGAPKGNQNAKKTTKQPPVESENNHRLISKRPNVNVNVNDNENVNVNNTRANDPVKEYLDVYPKLTKNILAVSEAFYMEIKTVYCLDDTSLIKAAENYAEAVKILKTEERYIKNPDRFIKDATYTDYLPENYKKPKPPQKKNTFIDHQQTVYDFDAIEKKMLGGG